MLPAPGWAGDAGVVSPKILRKTSQNKEPPRSNKKYTRRYEQPIRRKQNLGLQSNGLPMTCL